jgi:hypothetical protein
VIALLNFAGDGDSVERKGELCGHPSLHDFALRPPPDLWLGQPFKSHGRNFLFSRGAEVG